MKKTISAVVLAACLILGATVSGAFAQDSGEDPSAESGARSERSERAEVRRERLAEALAAELDLDPETVAAALDRIHEQFAEEKRTARRHAFCGTRRQHLAASCHKMTGDGGRRE